MGKRALPRVTLFAVLIIIGLVIGTLYLRSSNKGNKSRSGFVSTEIYNIPDPPNPPPECVVEHKVTEPETKEIQVRDLGDGIYKVNILSSDNTKIEIPEFNTTTKNVAPKNLKVVVTKINLSEPSRALLEVLDINLNRAECDSGTF